VFFFANVIKFYSFQLFVNFSTDSDTPASFQSWL
jgi:hypothetical protein